MSKPNEMRSFSANVCWIEVSRRENSLLKPAFSVIRPMTSRRMMVNNQSLGGFDLGGGRGRGAGGQLRIERQKARAVCWCRAASGRLLRWQSCALPPALLIAQQYAKRATPNTWGCALYHTIQPPATAEQPPLPASSPSTTLHCYEMVLTRCVRDE